MLTELIDRAATRYVDIVVSAMQTRVGQKRWSATVKPRAPIYTTPELPTFSFNSVGSTDEDLRQKLVRMLDLVEPIVAHRERYFTAVAEDREARREYLKANPVIVTEDGRVHPNTGPVEVSYTRDTVVAAGTRAH